jgi:hypothetical protein
MVFVFLVENSLPYTIVRVYFFKIYFGQECKSLVNQLTLARPHSFRKRLGFHRLPFEPKEGLLITCQRLL